MIDFDGFITARVGDLNNAGDPWPDIKQNLFDAKDYYNKKNYLQVINKINDINKLIVDNEHKSEILDFKERGANNFDNNIKNPFEQELKDLIEENQDDINNIIYQSKDYSSTINNADNILNNNDLRKTQQTENKNYFLNKYLYVIIKLIFIILLFIICFFLLKSNISFNINFSTIFSILNNKITNKIDNIKQKSKNAVNTINKIKTNVNKANTNKGNSNKQNANKINTNK